MLPISAFGNPSLTITNNVHLIDNFAIEILEDKQNDLTVDNVLQQPNWEVSSNKFSLGYSTSTFWLKLTINNPSNESVNKRLLFTESFLREVDLYEMQQGKWTLQANGAEVPIAKRQIYHHFPTFKISLNNNAQSVFLIKLNSDFGVFGSFLLLGTEEFHHRSLVKDSIHMFMFGALCIIALYNLFLWLNLKDIIYFYYVSYIAFYALWLSTYSGHILYITSPKTYLWVNTALPIAFIFLILFSQQLLTTKKIRPKTHKALTAMAFCFALSAIFIPFYTSISFQIQNALAVILLPFLLYIGIDSIQNSVNNAKIYTSALFVYFIGLTTLGLMALGILPYSNFTRYAPFPGSILEITLFSFALANRINQHKQQAIDAQTDLLIMQKNANKELEEKVKERTEKLNEQKKQLEQLSLTDSLTNIYNRRAFRDIFEDSNDNIKEGYSLTLIMIDIDFFKGYNDTYGHQAGDDALIAVAKVFERLANQVNGHAFRLGGEEFALLCFTDSTDTAMQQAEICRQSILDLAIENNTSEHQYLTISLGVVIATDNYFSMGEMYKFADKALYRSKDMGRNQVTLHQNN